MNDVLAMCGNLPEMGLAKGDNLIEEAVSTDRLYVSGAFEVVRNGVRVVLILEPGTSLAEISAMLGSTPMASVVAAQDSAVHVVDQASAIVQKRPELTYAIDRPSSAKKRRSSIFRIADTQQKPEYGPVPSFRRLG